jgi:uncharacterized membrane protein YeaQ/YmgE (transglycosylase-associated protein family)
VGFLLWLLMGFIVGSLAGFLMKSSYPWYVDVLLGIVGSFVGGWLTSIFLGVDMTGGFNLTTLLVSLLGAIVVIAITRLVTGRRSAV